MGAAHDEANDLGQSAEDTLLAQLRSKHVGSADAVLCGHHRRATIVSKQRPKCRGRGLQISRLGAHEYEVARSNLRSL